MVRFKTKEIDSYYAANSILNFIDYAESNLHSIGRYNGSLSLYRKCLYIRREDSLLYKYGEDNTGDIQRLKQFMRRCCREISLWKKVFEMIYTTYFAKLKSLPKDIVPISICGKAPNNYNGLQYKKLAPKYDFFMKWKENHDNDYYICCFDNQVLSVLNPTQVVADLTAMAAGRDVALVCYERPTDFCHRHLVAEWLQKNGYNVQEWSA